MRFHRKLTMMGRPGSTRPPLAAAAVAALVLGLALVASGCGGGDDESTALSAEQVAAFGSPYCLTARKWAVHELDGGGDDAAADPPVAPAAETAVAEVSAEPEPAALGSPRRD